MSWEWSHTNEAYTNASRNLHGKPREWLVECWAEIQARDENGEFDNDKFDSAKRSIAILGFASEHIADAIWDFASEQATCDNGGFNAWCCPWGCHTVPFDVKGE